MAADGALEAEGPGEVGVQVVREVAVLRNDLADHAESVGQHHREAHRHVAGVREQGDRFLSAHRPSGVGDERRHSEDLGLVAELTRDDRLREDRRTILQARLGPNVAAAAQRDGERHRRRLLDDDVLRAKLDVVERIAAVERELQVGFDGV